MSENSGIDCTVISSLFNELSQLTHLEDIQKLFARKFPKHSSLTLLEIKKKFNLKLGNNLLVKLQNAPPIRSENINAK